MLGNELDLETALFEIDPSQLNEDDLTVSTTGAVVTASDWTTETILSQLRQGNIDLSPSSQRREAWKSDRKSRYVESLFLGLPVPQIVLAERKDRRGSYIVIDGKQRLLSIRSFCVEEQYEGFDPLVLEGLSTRRDLNGKTWVRLKADSKYGEDVSAFENQAIRTVVVRNWPDEGFLYLVFLRLNTGSLPLSTQELRQALHPGPFTEFVDEYSSNSIPIQKALGLNAPDFRMRDVEILTRFFAFFEFIEQYKGDLKDFLDKTAKQYNQTWDRDEPKIKSIAVRCDRAIQTTIDIFGVEHAFKRWVNGRFQGQFNRAVFDIMTYYFGDDETSKLALGKKENVIKEFQNLCDPDERFNDALCSTTKSVRSTSTRLTTWGQALEKIVDRTLDIPKLGA